MKTNHFNKRRSFLKQTSGILAGLGLGLNSWASTNKKVETTREERRHNANFFPRNPLVLFDNFHAGNRKAYSWKARLAAAEKAGFDGFEFVSLDPSTDSWAEAMDVVSGSHFSLLGMHQTSNAVIDRFANQLEAHIEKIQQIVEACANTPIEYISLSLSGNDELRGPSIHESGSAKAQDRHWERAYKIIAAFDKACQKHHIRGALYPHTHWICDTPQSQAKILEGANATTIGPAFCSHHWYANKNALELDETLALPIMKQLNYVVLTNGRFQDNNFPATRFDLGEIDMAWMLAKIYEFGYTGPISSQGWGIGGDPYLSCKAFVDGIESIRKRFQTQPELWPLD